jgi:hypothetical protein
VRGDHPPRRELLHHRAANSCDLKQIEFVAKNVVAELL